MTDGTWMKSDVEVELRAMLRGVGLVGEVDLTPHGTPFTLARGNVERLLVAGNSNARIGRLFPASTVVYLVGEGVYRYARGAFWPELELKGIAGSEMGPAFIGALEDLGLETFVNVRPDGRHRWITPILLHGGIPKYCARDVLRLLLLEMRQGTNDATEMIARWVQSPSRMFTIDRPAQRFLTHGGEQALDLFERLIAMVRESAGGRTPDADELGIPAYLVEEFLALPEGERYVRRGATVLPTPRVVFDFALGHGPELVLPPVPAGFGARTWVIEGPRQQRFPVSNHNDTVVQLPVGSSWVVELAGEGGLLRSTTLRGVTGTPVLLFDASTMTLLRSQERIASDNVVALAPHGFAFRHGTRDGAAVALADAELPVLDGSWRWHEAQHLDLRGINTMWVGEPNPTPGLKSAEALVRIAGPSQRPHLLGESCEGVTGRDGRAVYSTPPAIVVPGGRLHGFDRWRMRIVVNGETETRLLSELPIVDDSIDLSAVLSPERISVVDLDVIGPLGSDLRGVRFTVIPGLQVEMPERVLLPDEQPDAIVIANSGIGFGHDRVSVCTVQIERGAESVTLTASDGNTDEIVLLTVPRLMWSIRLGQEAVRPLGVESVVLGFDEFGLDDALLVRTRRRVKLALELASTTSVIQTLPYVETVGSDGRWVFPLQKFRDTILGSDQTRLRLQLRLDGRAVPVAEIVAKYHATQLRATTLVDHDDGSALVSLTFDEERRFPGREVRLWSVDRPWQPVRQISVPDEASGIDGVMFTVTLPAGRYLVEVVLADAWATPVRPRRESTSVALISVGDSLDVRRYLRDLDLTDPLARFEKSLAEQHGRVELSTAEACDVARYALMTLDGLAEELRHRAITDPRFGVAASVVSTAPALVAGLRTLIEQGDLEPADVLRLVVLLLPGLMGQRLTDVDDAELHRVHRIHPVLAAIVDPAYIDDLAAGARWAEYMGWDPNAEDSSDAYPAKGGPAEGHWLQLSPERLRTIALSLDLTDQQPLAGGGFIKAMLEWLTSLAQETDATTSKWVERYRPLNDRRVSNLSEMHAAFLDAVKPQGVGFPPVARFPYDLLAAAIQLVSIGSSRAQATAALLDAATIAPALTIRSLLVAIVLDRG